MRHCQVAVIGQGLTGAAALDALLRRGVDAVGFDPLPLGTDRGSSHGSCRVFRRFNFESPHYTALADEALAGWGRLEVESGLAILHPCPVLEAGPRGCESVLNSRQAALDHGLDVPLLTGAQVNARFPAFNLPADWSAVVQPGGAILFAQNALTALRARAIAADRLVPRAVAFEPCADHVLVTAGDACWRAERVVLAAGPWTPQLLPGLAPLLQVTRQAVGWFEPTRPESADLEAPFPIFLIERAPGDTVYGFPDFEGRGVKAAPHNHGPAAGPDDWGPPATDAELAGVATALAELIPGAAGPIAEREVCLYTNTRAADRRPDAGEEFIIDRWPDSRLIIGSACSGHGAKFAPAIGERLARLAVEAGYQAEPWFGLSRYAAF